MAERHNFTLDTDSLSQETYLEITNVCNDFLESAKHAAMTIIDEDSLDVVDKTIQPVMESDCHGRSVEGDRGHAGRRYKFEAFNIRLKVCTDDHGLFNGDDECAAKGYGGREVLGALEYMKQHQPGEGALVSGIFYTTPRLGCGIHLLHGIYCIYTQ